MPFRYDILEETRHRPWPMPDVPWVMTQTWHDLLFAHWPVDYDRLRAKVPRELELDAWDDRAWVGIVPFHMTNVAPRGIPAPPVVSAFPELNVRTYVTVRGRPGVYFFSLDAGSQLAVVAARTLFGLPYHHAEMSVTRDGDGVRYSSRRHTAARPVADFDARYGPAGAGVPPRAGTIEYFLTERYCLYTVPSPYVVRRLEIHHPPWPLQPAEADITVNTMTEAAGIQLPAAPPLLHFARRQDMVAWLPQAVR